jgi:hypothetical protein
MGLMLLAGHVVSEKYSHVHCIAMQIAASWFGQVVTCMIAIR